MLRRPFEAQKHFEVGHFLVFQTAGCFNGILADMDTETSIFNDSKEQVSIVGITQNTGTLLRWSITLYKVAEYATAMQERTDYKQANCSQHEVTLGIELFNRNR